MQEGSFVRFAGSCACALASVVACTSLVPDVPDAGGHTFDGSVAPNTSASEAGLEGAPDAARDSFDDAPSAPAADAGADAASDGADDAPDSPGADSDDGGAVEASNNDAGPLPSGMLLMPYGGRYDTCVAAIPSADRYRLDVEPCSSSEAEQVSVVPANLYSLSPIPPGSPPGYGEYVSLLVHGLCVDILGGNETFPIIQVVECNGTENQLWLVQGGQISSYDTGGSGNPGTFCLDVSSPTVGAPVGLARCNGGLEQSFWPAAHPIGIASTFVDPGTGGLECLDLNGNAYNAPPPYAPAPFDDYDCNASRAQQFVLTTTHEITLQEDPSQCVALLDSADGGAEAGAGSIVLEKCDGSEGQVWYLSNASENLGCDAGPASCAELAQSALVNGAGGCLDVPAGTAAPSTLLDGTTCVGGTPAQLWVPYFSFFYY